MKTNTFIIIGLLLAHIAAFTLKANAQARDKCPSVINSGGNVTQILPAPILLADETTLIYQNNGAKIECNNDSIFKKIHETHSQLFKRFTCTWKHDHGSYKQYIIYINKDDADYIIKWAKTNL